MVRRFRGDGVQKMDGKGRVSLPPQFRRVLEECDPNWSDGKAPEFVIVYGGDDRNFLECFTIDAANEVDTKIAALARGSARRRYMERLFNGQSMMASVDDTGRFVLPARLRQKINVGQESGAYVIAMGDTFQIWNEKTFDGHDPEVEEVRKSIPPGADVWTLLEMEDV